VQPLDAARREVVVVHRAAGLVGGDRRVRRFADHRAAARRQRRASQFDIGLSLLDRKPVRHGIDFEQHVALRNPLVLHHGNTRDPAANRRRDMYDVGVDGCVVGRRKARRPVICVP
jgi:hypothetical protein